MKGIPKELERIVRSNRRRTTSTRELSEVRDEILVLRALHVAENLVTLLFVGLSTDVVPPDLNHPHVDGKVWAVAQPRGSG